MRRFRFIAGCAITAIAVACALGDSLLADGRHGEGVSFISRSAGGAGGICSASGVDADGNYCGVQIHHAGRHLHGVASIPEVEQGADEESGVPGLRLLPDGGITNSGNSPATDDPFPLPHGALTMTRLVDPTFGYGFFDLPGWPGAGDPPQGPGGSGNPGDGSPGNGSPGSGVPPGGSPPPNLQGSTPPGNGITTPSNPSDPSDPPVPVPEPLSLSLLMAGLVLAAGMRRLRPR